MATREHQLRAAIARESKSGGDPEKAAGLRREFKFVRAEEYIGQLVASAPPLTDDQRRRLAAILVPGGAA